MDPNLSRPRATLPAVSLDRMPPRRRQTAVKRARQARCTWCGKRQAVWSFRIPEGGELAAAMDNRKLALLCRPCFASARDDPDFEALNAGAADRLRLPEWYDDPATDAQRDYIAKLMADRGLGSLTNVDTTALRKGQASELIDDLLTKPAENPTTASESPAVH